MVAKPIRTLVVDDSIFMRTILKGALEKAPNIEVIGTAQNGNEALEKVAKLKPDVMTLDIEMPGLDGIGVLKKIMADSPMPIVMISTKTQE
ncbi:MAG: response regulator, partial [Planctomycetes bacterium]|nr:response regulator [Planctomycetota bacterium]